MNWLKIAAVAIGALLAFFIVSSVVGVILGLVGKIVILALVAGGGYVAYKVIKSGRGRPVKDRDRGREIRDDFRHDDLRQEGYTPPPPPPPSRPDVDDELNRLRREMGN